MAIDIAPITIRSVTIENFRGFRAAQTLDIAAAATIVSGPNGKGKTSFFDALQWLLLGSVARLAGLATRRSGDYIVNRFAGPTASALVLADITVSDRTISLSRVGDHRSSVLEWREGPTVLTRQAAEQALSSALLRDSTRVLRDAVLTSGILQQDVVRAVLEDEPKNRYKHMAELLGLQEIAGFEDRAKSSATERDRLAQKARENLADSEQELRHAQLELARLEQKLLSQTEITQARTRLEAELATKAAAFRLDRFPMQVADAIELRRAARTLSTVVDRLLAEDGRLQALEADLPEVDSARVSELQAVIAALGAQVAEARVLAESALQRQREAEKRAGRLAELAALALPLLGERCPVCDQVIDKPSVEQHLDELLAEKGEDLPSFIAAVREADEHVATLEQELDSLLAEQGMLERASRQAQEVTAARATWLNQCSAVATGQLSLQPNLRQRVAAASVDALVELRSSADQLSALADQLASLLGTGVLAEEVARQKTQLDTTRDRVLELTDVAAQLSREAEHAKTLATAATRAIASVTRNRFATLQPLVDDIFSRLAPHPAFTRLGFEMSVAYRSGVADPFVKDPESGVTGDPLLVFSSSQANVAALTYFLALSWAGGTKALPFVLLDDPLQSMDDVNALGFADLCRHLHRRRQLVVSTHENRLARLLERKLTPRSPGARARVLRFTGWDRSGPTIEQADIQPEAVGYLLEAG